MLQTTAVPDRLSFITDGNKAMHHKYISSSIYQHGTLRKTNPSQYANVILTLHHNTPYIYTIADDHLKCLLNDNQGVLLISLL